MQEKKNQAVAPKKNRLCNSEMERRSRGKGKRAYGTRPADATIFLAK